MWSIAQSEKPLFGVSAAAPSTELQEALTQFFKGFTGGVSFRRGIAVSMQGIKEALLELDGTVRGCAPHSTTRPVEEAAAAIKTIAHGESPAVHTSAAPAASVDMISALADPESRTAASSQSGGQMTKPQHDQAPAGKATDHEVVEID